MDALSLLRWRRRPVRRPRHRGRLQSRRDGIHQLRSTGDRQAQDHGRQASRRRSALPALIPRRHYMKSYVLFDRTTGELVQMHVEMDDLPENCTEHLEKLSRQRADPPVEFLEAETLQPCTSDSVDIKAMKLVPVDESKAKGAGGAVVQSIEGDPLAARTVIFQSDQERQPKR